jgi:hypothetical protein
VPAGEAPFALELQAALDDPARLLERRRRTWWKVATHVGIAIQALKIWRVLWPHGAYDEPLGLEPH